MKIGFKLFASLTDYLPPDRRGNRVELEVEEGMTIAGLIAHYQVPERSAHLVLVDGVFIPPAQRTTHQLHEGNEVAIWPPIAGG